MNAVKIPLDPPVTIGAKRYDFIKVRPPSYFDYLEVGEVLAYQVNDGVRMTIEHLDRLKEYAERCVTTGDDPIAEPAVLVAGGFPLARKVHEALCGFLYSPAGKTGTT